LESPSTRRIKKTGAEMKESTWEQLDEEFNRFPIMRSEPTTIEEVQAAAERVGRPFHSDYSDFLRRYGGAIVGAYPIFGLRQAEAMGNAFWSVVDVTNRFRTDGWAGTSEWYVISMDGGGNPIGVSSDGKVWISDHDAGEVTVIAPDFETFLLRQCLSQGSRI
jgi:hypothetical protein